MCKKIFIGAVILLALFLPATGYAAVNDGLAIELNGVGIQAVAYIDEGNVYLPLRAVGEAMGYEVDWSEKDGAVVISGAGKNITVDLKNNKITANDHVYYMGWDEDGKIIGNRTYMEAGFFTGNLGLDVFPDRQGNKVKLKSVQENDISITTVKEASDTGIIEINLQYPQIDGLADKAVQDSINSFFRESARAARDEGLKNAASVAEDDSGSAGSPNKHVTYFDYRIKYNQNGLLSVVLTDYQYTGGAHGLAVQSSRTFDLKTGAVYRLEDLFIEGADYVSIISGIIKDEISKRVREGILPEYTFTPFEAIKADQDFYLSNGAVVVYFQYYEYWPYAFGIQEFPVDFSALKDILKPGFGFLINDAKMPEAS